MNKKTVLIVDDDMDILDSLDFSLGAAGFTVVRAKNGWEALGAVRATDPDLILLDVMMPMENGYRVARMIKEDIRMGVYKNNIPIIFLTARQLEDEPEREKFFMNFSRADDVIYKPFEMDKLVSRVKEMLGLT